eukprot:scaffold37413_cov22-Tisochrysis_lutea.AAC.2
MSFVCGCAAHAASLLRDDGVLQDLWGSPSSLAEAYLASKQVAPGVGASPSSCLRAAALALWGRVHVGGQRKANASVQVHVCDWLNALGLQAPKAGTVLRGWKNVACCYMGGVPTNGPNSAGSLSGCCILYQGMVSSGRNYEASPCPVMLWCLLLGRQQEFTLVSNSIAYRRFIPRRLISWRKAKDVVGVV